MNDVVMLPTQTNKEDVTPPHAMPESPSTVGGTAAQLRSLIRERRIAPGTALPTYQQLCVELGVSYVTLHRGMAKLEAEGLVRRVRGKGTFVLKGLYHEPRPLRHLGIIYPSSLGSLLVDKPYLHELLRGITSAASAGVDLHIFTMRDEGMVNASHLHKWSVDGTILLGIGSDDYLRAYVTWGTPGVVVDHRPEGVPIDSVTADNPAAADRVVAHVAGLGHRHVALAMTIDQQYVVDPQDLNRTLLVRQSSEARERREHALRALQAHGLRVSDIGSAVEGSERIGRLLALLRSSDRPTVVIADSDMVAHQLLRELARVGVKVPDEISVCAIAGSFGYAQRESLVITCCHIDFTAMGRSTVERLAMRCREPTAEAVSETRIGFSFVAGSTTGQVRSKA